MATALPSPPVCVCVCRTPVKCGGVVRLQHLQTKKFLHSHFFSSPLSHNQEVSAFANAEGDGDEGGQLDRGLLLGLLEQGRGH